MGHKFESSFEYKLIYIIEIEGDTHKGLLKIGDATIKTSEAIDKLPPNSKLLNQSAKLRIKQYTNTAGLSPTLLHTELAVYTKRDSDGNISLKAFRDRDVHKVLENSGIPKKKIGSSTSREWFKIDLSTALKAIEAVKKNQSNLSNTTTEKFIPIVFRPEQDVAITETLKQFKHGNRMLWNAKMRFGKTLSALEVIRKSNFKKTIIITHRPVVDKGWYEDFRKIFSGSDDYIFGSKNSGNTIDDLLKQDKYFVYFASIQDLRGSEKVGGKFEKNDTIFSLDWDFVIIDEAHEGTTTALGNEVIKRIFKGENEYNTKFLALSGTPFNILNDYSDNIYTWDYVMEQRQKCDWDEKYFGDSNPYDELPELKIYTYDLGNIFDKNKEYQEIEDKAFNFREFFRVYTGMEHTPIPTDKSIGQFVHESDVNSFLNLITKEDAESRYPFASKENREIFKHTLWMVPGVKEAKALSKLLKTHPVFGLFNVVNVAGDGDEEEASEEALKKVQEAIDKAEKTNGFTITLSCGRLTTGVTVREWTGVFMLSGSFSTSAANYLQTIFRVQSPCNINGKIKQCSYVFDFAPDRTLKMVAESVAMSTKAGKQSESDRKILGDFLNFCPVIAIDGTAMKSYDTNLLLQQLKRAYAERAVRNGFDDNNLYNDELLKLDEDAIEKFKDLRGIVGSSKSAPRSNDIVMNDTGLTNEEYEELERIEKKPKKQRTAEEEEKLNKIAEQKRQKLNAISILRGISIRMPLLIYGAEVNINEDITMDKLIEIVEDASWNEFMPQGVTKKIFKEFMKYYDTEVFVAAGRKIRDIAHSADELLPTERVMKISQLFTCFKNPDKETVLTPWRVVNMHMGDCLGGYNFFDEAYAELLGEPRFIDKGKVTTETFANKSAKILEINSKTGLYPLYATYSIFRNKCNDYTEEVLDRGLQEKLWQETVEQNIFIICKTPMAKSITKRTLVGYKDIKVNTRYFENLINMLKNKPEQFKSKVLRPSYWDVGGVKKMKFDAVIGNPPYHLMDGGSKASATPVYHRFIQQSKDLNNQYTSMIVPARWFSGGRGLDSFREEMLNDEQLRELTDFTDSNDCFPGVDIAGGVCYFLWEKDHIGECNVKNIHKGDFHISNRKLNKHHVFVRYGQAIPIIDKIFNIESCFYDKIVSSQKPFGLRTYVKPTENGDIMLRYSGGMGSFPLSKVKSGLEWVDKWKVIMSYLTYDHAGRADKNGQRRIFSTMEVLPPKSVCTETYLVIDTFDDEKQAQNLYYYLRTRFIRFLVSLITSTQHLSKSSFAFVPVQDFSESWTDEKLYAKYGITEDEIGFIESMIRPME